MGYKSSGTVLAEKPSIGIEPTRLFDRTRNKNHGVHTNITMVQLPSGLWVPVFNGTNGTIVIPHAASLNLSTWTFEIWIKSVGAPAQNEGLITKDNGTDQRDFFWLIQTGGNQFLGHRISNVNKELTGNDTITDEIWHYLVAVNDGTSLILYNQGEQDAIDGTLGGTTDNDGFEVHIGLWRAASSEYLEGMLALPRIYNYALSAGQIKRIFDYQNARWFGV